MNAVLAWVAAHPFETLAGLAAVLSIVNGALPASVQRGPVGRALHTVLDRLAVLSRSDASGTLKWPGVASAVLSPVAVVPPSVGPLAPAADPVAPPPTPVEPASVLRATTVSYRPSAPRETVAPPDISDAHYEAARAVVHAEIGAPSKPDQGGHVEGGAMLGACLVALVVSLCVGCPDWQRPACPTPGTYSCVNDQPHYCARATHELTPVGDEPCGAQGRICAFNDAGQSSCARLDAAVSE